MENGICDRYILALFPNHPCIQIFENNKCYISKTLPSLECKPVLYLSLPNFITAVSHGREAQIEGNPDCFQHALYLINIMDALEHEL